ncbi:MULTISPECIES: hypothetical protein [unclassified Cryobacterium]|uniref:hypothetical protein n=1 Tax=unclassified Cryobacterium TaxID=2649013 RepID=UPI002AB3AA42|nr:MULTISPECIES: hypothetical protein [unclassified Cryobacterium]MDY7542647.1 hypothetical protein [Cryobacterium sp. 5B3]MEB0264767.1 hypothetical protein [Cryobacterium sp. 10I5]MEB0273739.1 hypothetical protein [Cryobacterium sp. 5B3]
MSISPRNFDPHADDIDGPNLAWSDPEISRIGVHEERSSLDLAVARALTLPPVPTAPVAPTRRQHRTLPWVATALVVLVAALLVLAVVISQ